MYYRKSKYDMFFFTEEVKLISILLNDISNIEKKKKKIRRTLRLKSTVLATLVFTFILFLGVPLISIISSDIIKYLFLFIFLVLVMAFSNGVYKGCLGALQARECQNFDNYEVDINTKWKMIGNTIQSIKESKTNNNKLKYREDYISSGIGVYKFLDKESVKTYHIFNNYLIEILR